MHSRAQLGHGSSSLRDAGAGTGEGVPRESPGVPGAPRAGTSAAASADGAQAVGGANEAQRGRRADSGEPAVGAHAVDSGVSASSGGPISDRQVVMTSGPAHGRDAVDSGEWTLSVWRFRLLRAMADVVAERGLRKASVAEVTRRASVSHHVFLDLFGGFDGCMQALLDWTLERVSGLIWEAARRESCWQDGVLAGIETALVFLESEPALARACLLEVVASSAEERARRTKLFNDLAALIDTARAHLSLERQPPDLTAEAALMSVLGILRPAPPAARRRGAAVRRSARPADRGDRAALLRADGGEQGGEARRRARDDAPAPALRRCVSPADPRDAAPCKRAQAAGVPDLPRRAPRREQQGGGECDRHLSPRPGLDAPRPPVRREAPREAPWGCGATELLVAVELRRGGLPRTHGVIHLDGSQTAFCVNQSYDCLSTRSTYILRGMHGVPILCPTSTPR